MNKERVIKTSVIAAILLSVFLGILIFFQVVIDDAFIFFKYGYNLVHYGVWSWSIEGKPTEAYTSFLYAVLSVFPPLINIQPHIFIKLVGLVLFFTLLYRVYKQLESTKYGLFVLLIIVANWQVYVHAFSGLETILWTWLLLEAFFILNNQNRSSKQQIILWVLCLLLTLTRPEGAIYSLFFFCYLFFYEKSKLNYIAILSVSGIGLIYFIIRFSYFGLLFPLPFYHKVMDNQLGKFALIFNLYMSWHYLICAGLMLYFNRKNKTVYYIGLLSFFIFFILYGKSFLVMNFADRFPFQLFFPFVIFVLIQSERSISADKAKLLLVAGFLNLIIFSKGLYNENFIELASITNNAGSVFFVPRSHYLLAKNINKIDNIEKKNIKVLFGDAGVFPHYAKVKCYDYNGLTDAYVATHKLTNKYFENIDADVVLIGTPNVDKENLIKDPTNCKIVYTFVDKNPNYIYLGYTISKPNGYYVHVFNKLNTKNTKELEDALTTAINESHNAIFRIKRFLKWKYLDMDNI